MNRTLKILLVADALALFAFGLLTPIYAIFVEQIGGDVLDVGLTYAAYLFSVGILTYYISKWENKQKHKEKIVMFGYALHAITAMAYFFVTTSTQLLMVQVLFGIAGAFLSPVYDGMFSKFLDKGKFVFEWGVYSSMNHIVTGIAAITGAAIVYFYSFKTLFTIMFLFSLIGFLASLTLKDKSQNKEI